MTYTVPAGTTLAEVLEIQYGGAPGIRTRQESGGLPEIFDWPESLGATPTQAQVTAWANAQLAEKPDRLASEAYQAARLLRAFAIALKIQVPALNLQKLADDTKAAFKNL